MSLPSDITPQRPPFTLSFAHSFSKFIGGMSVFLYTRPTRDAALFSTSSGLPGKEGLHTAVILWIIPVKV